MRTGFLTCLWLLLLALSPAASASSEPLYDLGTMRRMNPDFSTYPDARGILWLKQTSFARSEGGGVERTDLRVLLGRKGLDERWLTWNIQEPEGGRAELVKASAYSFETGEKIRNVSPRHDAKRGLHTVEFSSLPETFILAVAWRQTLPEQLAMEGLCWFSSDEGRESLPVWESIVEVTAPASQTLLYRAFPEDTRPETEEDARGRTTIWRRINVDPAPDFELAVTPRAGVAFGTRRGDALSRLMLGAEQRKIPSAPAAAIEGFKKSKENGMKRLLSWLWQQPEVILSEGEPRAIPASEPWTRQEKIALAQGWLAEQGVKPALLWRLPLDLKENPPACAGLLGDAVLELPVLKGSRPSGETFFYAMEAQPVMGATSPFLKGIKVAGMDKKTFQKIIPASKAGDNRLSAYMDLKMDAQGALSGKIRTLLRGAWVPLLLGSASTEAELRDAVRSLFPELQNYSGVQLKTVKGAQELSFNLDGKAGVAGSGQGLLALLPVFEPASLRALAGGGKTSSLELSFPFIMEQSLTVLPPKGTERVLVSDTASSPQKGKIKFSGSYANKRNRLSAEARFEAGSTSLTGGDLSLFHRNLTLWREFCTRPIPVRVKAK